MSGAQPGPRNPNWKGGRTVASNGYVLVKMSGHHLAHGTGYVYEHRVVAERVLGRRLRPGEIPHHKNGIRTDNRPENLEIVASRAHHHVHHRTKDRGLRLPGEPNLLVSCACGCGATFSRYDSTSRPRRFVSGHNMYGGRRG